MALEVSAAPRLFSPDTTPAPHVSREAGRAVVWLRGEQDAASVRQLCEVLARESAATEADIVVDLTDVTFIDGATVGALVRGRSFLRFRQRELTLRSAPRCARRVLSVCGLNDLLDGNPTNPRGPQDPWLAQPDNARRAAADEREAAAADRRAAAHDRDVAAKLLQQIAALREAAAYDRRRAALSRLQAGIDRVAASTDELTGALLRREGFPALQREIDRCRRSSTNLVLGFVDVDAMKQVNDIRGHQAGDQLLHEVAQGLRASLRSYDVVVRFGGDEFVYSLAGAVLGEAVTRFEEVQSSLVYLNGNSVSAGFAELGVDDTLETLIARADADLYARRRASTAGSSEVDPPRSRAND